MIELYHAGPRGHSASVLIALAEKRLAFEDRALDLSAFDQHAEAFLAINPAGQVPVLRDDGRTLTETFFILLYLEDRYPHPPLDGADARARYAVQKWGKYVETHIAPNLAIVAWAGWEGSLNGDAVLDISRLPPERGALWASASAGFSEADVEAARSALIKAAARIAEDLAGSEWLAGADWSLADIIVFPHVAPLASLGIDVPAIVENWLGRVAARPAVRSALGDQGVLMDVATMGPERGRWG